MHNTQSFRAAAPPGPRSGWPGLFILLGLAGLVFAPALRVLADQCQEDSNNSHIAFVPFISAYLIWQARSKLAALPESSSGRGLAVLLVGLSLYLLGQIGQMQVVSNLAIALSAVGLIWYNLGDAKARSIAFPLFFLLFVVPMPNALVTLVSFPLQLFATAVSANAMDAIGIPVLREGNMLYFAHTQLEVAEACSGIRSMMAFLMLGALFAYLTRGRAGRRLLLVALAVPLAVVMNILRVTGTGILAYAYDDRIARGFLHEFSGLVVFAAGFCVMAGLHVILDRKAAHDA